MKLGNASGIIRRDAGAEGRERGSAAVLLTVLFAGLILLAAVMFAASKEAANRSRADAALQVAGRSILSEYDRKLNEDYGLFAFKGDGARAEKDIAFYADAGLKRDKTAYLSFIEQGAKISVFDSEVSAVNVNLKEFSVANADIFEAQINAAALTESIKRRSESSEDSGQARRTLRNESVIESLPSKGLSDGFFSNLSRASIPTLGEVADRAGDGFLTSEYIINVFNHANGGIKRADTFFGNEIEYILSGKMSDDANYRSVRANISLIRFFLNNEAFLKDPEKMRKVKELAVMFAPVYAVGEPAAELIITEAWILAETKNDMLLLEDGRNVAMFKNANTWAIQDIKGILDGVFLGGPEIPIDPGGQSYEDYLRILLFLADREAKLLRAMDLIQLNMKGTYDSAFQLREYYAGFRFEATVDGKTYVYTERYDGDE
ncbi:MAG: DUF5702 domain-containing protein [Clostridiales Family XIII bacterium]|jgi:hypothetical protein|nr:DUF5702 domain-containing protein [Clostridiales Family XIII bacterium]